MPKSPQQVENAEQQKNLSLFNKRMKHIIECIEQPAIQEDNQRYRNKSNKKMTINPSKFSEFMIQNATLQKTVTETSMVSLLASPKDLNA